MSTTSQPSSVCIIGSGLAGLATAIKVKLNEPATKIVVLEKKNPESNTQIAGMRFRAHQPGKGDDPITELKELLQYIENGERAEKFSSLILQEIEFWQKAHLDSTLHNIAGDIKPLQTREQISWFGPQWENGSGLEVLNWFRNLAEKLGVQFIKAEVLKIRREGQRISSVTAESQEGFANGIILELSAEKYVLAAGSASGFITLSTNKNISEGSAQLALEAQLPLVGLTNNMFHPFGRCKDDGTPLNGCFGTDELAGVKVFLANGRADEETTELLRKHQAHDNFPEIIERFSSIKNLDPVVTLVFENGRECRARVSHHYCQLGLQTEDGVTVEGVTNLFAVGDAEGWFLTNHQQRLPGFGLSKCLVDAELVVQRINREGIKSEATNAINIEISKQLEKPQISLEAKIAYKKIKQCNTKYLLEIFKSNKSKREVQAIILSWFEELKEHAGGLEGFHPILELSTAMIAAHQRKFCEEGREPILIDTEMIHNFTEEKIKEAKLIKEGRQKSIEG